MIGRRMMATITVRPARIRAVSIFDYRSDEPSDLFAGVPDNPGRNPRT